MMTFYFVTMNAFSQTQLIEGLNAIDTKENKLNVNIRIPKTKKLDFENILVDQFLLTVLKLNGVSIDQQSEIKYHEENSYIDIDCFNCVNGVHTDENINAMPDNKTGGDRRF